MYITRNFAQHQDFHNNTGGGHNPGAVMWKDLQGNNDATLDGATWGDKALIFDGNSLARFVGTLTPSFTYMFVGIRFAQTKTHPRFTADNPYTAFYLQSAQNFAYAVYGQGTDGAFNPAKIMPINKYVHLAVRYVANSKVLELFENGTKIGTRPATSEPVSTAFAYFGNRAAKDRGLVGGMCNFLRYSDALTDAEIQHNYEIDKILYIDMDQKFLSLTGLSTLVSKIKTYVTSITGLKSTLVTTDKSSLVGAINEVAGSLGSGGINYSTEEQDTGLMDVDGYPVFQKTLFIQGSGYFRVDHNLSTRNVVSSEMLIEHILGEGFVPVPFNNYTYDVVNTTPAVFISETRPNLTYLVVADNLGEVNLRWTLRYTKLDE